MSETPKVKPHKFIGVAVISNPQGQILIDRRLPTGLMAGLWEFPGGKIEPDETVEECIKREILEELALDIEVGQHLITIEHDYLEFRVTLIAHLCQYLGGEPQALGCQEIRWVTLAEMGEFTFPEANQNIIHFLSTSKR